MGERLVSIWGMVTDKTERDVAKNTFQDVLLLLKCTLTVGGSSKTISLSP